MMFHRAIALGILVAFGVVVACSDASTSAEPSLDGGPGTGASDAGTDSKPSTDAKAGLKGEWKVAISGLARTPYGVWGSGSNDVWVAASAIEPNQPEVMRFDGSAWSLLNPGPLTLANFAGTSSSDVWAVETLPSVDAGAPKAVATHFDGASWRRVGVEFEPGAISATWAAAPNDVWAVGAVVAHYDGTSWSYANPSPEFLYAVSGTSASNVWAVGNLGQILHYDGSKWTSIASGTTQHFTAVWASSPTDVWLGASGGPEGVGSPEGPPYKPLRSFFHSTDGLTFAPVEDVRMVGEVAGLWGASADDIWAVGSDGSVAKGLEEPTTKFFHYDGSRWTDVPAPSGVTRHYVLGIWGSSATNIWAVGYDYLSGGTPGIIFHFE